MHRGTLFIIGLLFSCLFTPFLNQPGFQKTPFPAKVEAQTEIPCEVWRPTFVSDPMASPQVGGGYGAVWTGTELIAWGGNPEAPSGSRYNPVSHTWKAMSQVNAPETRQEFSAVWTGTEMIVWGGRFRSIGTRKLNTGGRYNPVSDTWTPTSTVNAPEPRQDHSAVWTGTEMIVWGGIVNGFPTGGKYNPTTDTWTPINETGAPPLRDSHFSMWTGKEMLIWGTQEQLSMTGGRYDPASNTWKPISFTNAPTMRTGASVTWTGTEMIVWGGYDRVNQKYLNTGSRYDPGTDRWLPMTLENALPPGSYYFAVWMGTGLLVVGPQSPNVAMYLPTADQWVSISYDPALSYYHGGIPIWTGKEVLFGTWNMVHYNPQTDRWKVVRVTNEAPGAMLWHTAVWSGAEMIVWGHLNGKRYDPVANRWKLMSEVDAPSQRWRHTAIWTGTEMIVWGGVLTQQAGNTGARYNPATDTWTPMSRKGAPLPRFFHSAVWTGHKMIVWGGVFFPNYPSGFEAIFRNDGGIYDPQTDTWEPLGATPLLEERSEHLAVWTGTEMIIFGGNNYSKHLLPNGARYNPETHTWLPLPTENAPDDQMTGVWTGKELILVGSHRIFVPPDRQISVFTGRRYNPEEDVWHSINVEGIPERVSGYVSAVWTGTEMVVGTDVAYNPVTDRWRSLSPINFERGVAAFPSIWTGSEVIIWGGGHPLEPDLRVRTGGRYRPCPD
ncbi:MAG: hypothetical protein K1Y36_17000 [Blastocatellia bacterium]|nr:hypothetical protein [Blastocatellia bacterium]